MKSTETYNAAIKSRLGRAKNGPYESHLAHPTPAGLRELCLVLFDNGLSKNDVEIFQAFFQVKDSEPLREKIAKVDIDKFRTVCNFLAGRNDKPNMRVLNLTAVLTDFRPRPFGKYLQESHPVNEPLPTFDELEEEVFNTSITTNNKRFEWVDRIRPSQRIGTALLFIVVVAGIWVYTNASTRGQCMQWQNDRYFVVDCEAQDTAMVHHSVIPFSRKLLNLRKIELTDTTRLFKYGQPLVWYCKQNGAAPEFFNCRGVHPVTGKDLKPITKYMGMKYAKVTRR